MKGVMNVGYIAILNDLWNGYDEFKASQADLFHDSNRLTIVCQIHKLALNILDSKVLITDN